MGSPGGMPRFNRSTEKLFGEHKEFSANVQIQTKGATADETFRATEHPDLGDFVEPATESSVDLFRKIALWKN